MADRVTTPARRALSAALEEIVSRANVRGDRAATVRKLRRHAQLHASTEPLLADELMIRAREIELGRRNAA